MYDIPESDWKVFRKLREIALERICERALAEMGRIASEDKKTYHARYLEIFKLIRERDDDIAVSFNNPRRSVAVSQLASMVSLDLVTHDELLPFTESTRDVVESWGNSLKRHRRRSRT